MNEDTFENIMEYAKLDEDEQEAYETYARDLFIDDYYFTDGYVFRKKSECIQKRLPFEEPFYHVNLSSY